MARDMVGIREAVRGWDVSERALRRRLATGEIDDSERADDGSWLLPSDWLDGEFERSVIDLRDPVVSDGLAAVLSELSGMTEKVNAAEVRAGIAESQAEHAIVRLRTVTDQLEQAQTENQRLQVDYQELQRELAVKEDRLTRAESEVERAWTSWADAESLLKEQAVVSEEKIGSLVKQRDRVSQKLRLAESLTVRRKRRFYEQMASQIDNGGK